MKEILLTKGKVAIVDDEFFDELNSKKWQYHSCGYACCDNKEARGQKILMHRVILGAKGNEVVDHKNGNKLDNRKENLRVATTSQNSANSKKIKNCVSKYKGVGYANWGKRQARWTMRIRKDGKVRAREYYNTEIEAARAYNRYAIELFGEFARLNQFDEVA